MTTDPYEFPSVPQPTADFALGACRNHPTSMFFPGRGDWQSMLRAKAICETCQIREACLEFALESGEMFGVWGGTSGKERRIELSRRSREAKLPRIDTPQPH